MSTPQELSSFHQMIAYKDAVGKGPTAIAQELGCSVQTVYNARGVPEYVALVESVKREIRERLVDNAARVQEAYNEEVMPAFETTRELHKGADSDAVRLGAAKDILDRAPDAPKVQKHLGDIDARMIIQFPVQAVGNMKQALEDVGKGEIVEMLERGGGFEAQEDQVSEDGMIRAVPIEEMETFCIE